jgi:hypothetical protein
MVGTLGQVEFSWYVCLFAKEGAGRNSRLFRSILLTNPLINHFHDTKVKRGVAGRNPVNSRKWSFKAAFIQTIKCTTFLFLCKNRFCKNLFFSVLKNI